MQNSDPSFNQFEFNTLLRNIKIIHSNIRQTQVRLKYMDLYLNKQSKLALLYAPEDKIKVPYKCILNEGNRQYFVKYGSIYNQLYETLLELDNYIPECNLFSTSGYFNISKFVDSTENLLACLNSAKAEFTDIFDHLQDWKKDDLQNLFSDLYSELCDLIEICHRVLTNNSNEMEANNGYLDGEGNIELNNN